MWRCDGVKVTDRRLRRLPCVLVVGVVGCRGDALSPPVPEDTWVDRASGRFRCSSDVVASASWALLRRSFELRWRSQL